MRLPIRLAAAAFCMATPFLSHAETINVQLRWHHQFQFAGFYAAVDQGYYRDAGLEVELRAGAPGVTPVNEVLTGRSHYGVGNSEVLLERLQGRPLIALASVYQHSPSVLLVKKDRNIKSPHDLVGKRVMLMDRRIDADLLAMFINEGIDLSQIDIIPSSYDIDDLAEGRTDAFNSYLSNEPFYLRKRNVAYTVIDPHMYGVDFYSDIIFTSENETLQHPERVEKFLAASLQGWQYALDHPDEIIDLLIEKYGVTKSREHLAFEAATVENLILPNIVTIGHMNPGRWKHMAETFQRLDMIESIDRLDGFIFDPARDQQEDVERFAHLLRLATGAMAALTLIVILLYLVNRKTRREVELRRIAEEEIKKIAYSDALTKLPNRLQLFARAEQMLRSAKRQNEKLALCFLDLNDFKLINDAYGHRAGDVVLIHIGEILVNALRESDIAARLGGDEFVIILSGIEDRTQVSRLISTLRKAFKEPIYFEGHGIKVSASLGVAVYPAEGDSIDALITAADHSMYRVKLGTKAEESLENDNTLIAPEAYID
ncbi:MAG: ABC transporter substrate-binding protein [Pseudomonadota bacterium]|nr:ABC transporter substrate-binding protein [Pseudomonadota bacterium]